MTTRDSSLEAFRHNPTDDSFAPPAGRTAEYVYQKSEPAVPLGLSSDEPPRTNFTEKDWLHFLPKLISCFHLRCVPGVDGARIRRNAAASWVPSSVKTVSSEMCCPSTHSTTTRTGSATTATKSRAQKVIILSENYNSNSTEYIELVHLTVYFCTNLLLLLLII